MACLRLSSSNWVYCGTSPWRMAVKLAPNDLANPMLRTTRPNATPRSVSTTIPGSSKPVVTRNLSGALSLMAQNLNQAPPALTRLRARRLRTVITEPRRQIPQTRFRDHEDEAGWWRELLGDPHRRQDDRRHL